MDYFSFNNNRVDKKQIGNNVFLLNTKSPEERVEITINNISKDYSIITSGWHTWSGYKNRSQDVGMGNVVEKVNNSRNSFFVEPYIHNKEDFNKGGKSYSYVVVRGNNENENILVAVIPDFKNIDILNFRFENNQLKVNLSKYSSAFKSNNYEVLVAKGKYTEIINLFNNFLQNFNKLSLMNERVMWFSWAAYGKSVSQVDIDSELPYLAEIGVDTMILDDGWEMAVGQWEINTTKFPNMIGLVENIKKMKIKPGIWIAPFMIMKESQLFSLHKDWIMKNDDGSFLEVTNFQLQPTNKPLPIIEKSCGLDISIPEARKYAIGEILRLAKIGFEVFKLDFISIPFAGDLKNREKTIVEYYRMFFSDLRFELENLKKQKQITNFELIGCGGPLFESIGLFEGIRITDDSAMPALQNLDYFKKIISLFLKFPFLGRVVGNKFKNLQTFKYQDASAVAFKRALVFRNVLGLLIDGVHLNDPLIEIDKKTIDNTKEALPAFKYMGLLTNFFVGDSLVRSGLKGRLEWLEFINLFKLGKKSWIEEATGNVLVEN